jgi:branched-chain amino acid transport system ATP-binding protein
MAIVRTETSDDVVLQMQGVTVRFGEVHAVRDVDLTIGPGERFSVIGPNGAGKTTLFRTIVGEVRPDTGSVHLFRRDVTTSSVQRRARLGLGRTYQVSTLFGTLTVEENVALAVLGQGKGRLSILRPVRFRGDLGDRVGQALVSAGLERRRHDRADGLSHGEQRQLELAIGVATDPKLLLLDEPAAGLSAAERAMMRELIADLPTTMALVLVEHDMTIALEVAERVLVLNNGEEVATGPPDEIRANEAVRSIYLRDE